MNEPLFNATTHQISLLYEAWMNNEISTSEWTEHSHRLNQQLLEAARPVAPPEITPCHGCRHYHGKTYGNSKLVCAMHPSGFDGDCPDREDGEQYQRQLDVQRDKWIAIRGVWSSATNYESPSETYEINPQQMLTRSRTFKRVNGRRILESEEVRPATEEELQELYLQRFEHISDGALDALSYVLGYLDG